ncbi:response regulator transcription factor [Paenibacillus beijingensis]|uniref:Chemotaxis protein CheY n=1 Tax=Paenibacillus beijingensis TaxID=1126833 RepID=A0A0D5NI07_9BACL|nr:response regulator transcription factor [Paenibacillus beijingensis]AJY74558.1 hypothetical protein VN24_08225 [Paenibacillus beijingensis]
MAGEMILIVDDEMEIGGLLGMYLQKEGYRYHVSMNGAQALQFVEELEPDLIVLDVFLPDLDGYELCRQLRTMTTAPIMFLSCRDTELDKVVGLSVGGDDYLSKPFSPPELVARIKAHLRRSQMQLHRLTVKSKSILSSKSLQVHLDSHEVYVDGEKIELSAKEYQLLSYFMLNSKQVLSFDQLLLNIWGMENEVETKTLQVHVGNLRKKIEKDPAKPQRLVTVRGTGYKFNEAARTI